MRIIPLSNVPHFLHEIAEFLHNDWGQLPPWSDLENVKRRLQSSCGPHPFPRTFVAISEQGEFLGTASVKLNELAHHADKMYWLAEVYVRPAERGQGIGTQLIEAVVDYSFGAGAERLFLYTPDQQALYERLGWLPIGNEIVNDESVTIMRLDQKS